VFAVGLVAARWQHCGMILARVRRIATAVCWRVFQSCDPCECMVPIITFDADLGYGCRTICVPILISQQILSKILVHRHFWTQKIRIPRYLRHRGALKSFCINYLSIMYVTFPIVISELDFSGR